MQLLSLQDKCTHPEDVRLCTMIVKSNGSFGVNKKKVVRRLFFSFRFLIHSFDPRDTSLSWTHLIGS